MAKRCYVFVAGCLLITAWRIPCAVGAEAVMYTVTVVDCQADPIADAEVVAYERESHLLTDEDTPHFLCQPQKTNQDGRVTLQLAYKRESQVMVVARKEGYAIGWDVLPHEDRGRPTINIILDRPVVFSGTVVDDEGRPVAGVTVRAQPKICKLMRLEQMAVIGPAEWMTARTDKSGRFELRCFGADVLTNYVVTGPGSPLTCKFRPYALESCGYESGRDARLKLSKLVEVKGTVTDDKGQKVAQAVAVIKPDHANRDYRKDYVPQQCLTDKNGQFLFADVPEGGHYLEVLNTDTSKPWTDKRIHLDTDKQRCDNLDIQLETGGTLTVEMLDETSKKPISDLCLVFYTRADDEVIFRRQVETNAEGKVTLVVPEGVCKSYSWDERFDARDLELPEIEKGKAASASLQLAPGTSVAGTVRYSDEKAASGVFVAMTWGQKVLSDVDGGFRCAYDRMREGLCVVAWDVDKNMAAAVPVGNPDKTSVITLKPARTLTGTVVDANDQPLPAVRVTLNFNGPGYLSNWSSEVLTDKLGRFEFRAVAAEMPEKCAWRISATAMNHGARTYEKLQIEQEDDKLIRLKPLRMYPADQTVDGIVVKPDGTAAAGFCVFLHGDSQYNQSTVTDENGRFRFERVCKGEVRLQGGISSDEKERGFATARAGDKDIKIILGERTEHVPAKPSLIDKPLPEFSGVEWIQDADLQDQAGGILLICFWDYNQRPSRYAIGKLAEMTKILAEKKVGLILIHGCAYEESAVNWLTEKKLTCRNGHIKAIAEQVFQSWGVQSLPWLILTDKNKKVTAEGFAVKELEDKIKAL